VQILCNQSKGRDQVKLNLQRISVNLYLARYLSVYT